MKPALLLPLALASLGLAGLAIYAVQNREPVRPRAQASADTKPAPRAAEESPLARMIRAGQTPTIDPRPASDDDPPADAPASLKEVPSRNDALSTFEALLGQLEEIDDPKELGAKRREELYNGITGSFTVLSAQLGPGDRQLLEDSYARMMSNFERLKI
ncbi:MAG: hypothetical protein KC420_14560, partial [Myxococcales bacterium]|nr:hypothetical protein [Myxococcales bacterium]